MYSGKLFISADELSKEDIKKYKLLAINSNIDRLIFSTSEENWKEGALEKLNKLEEELGNYNVELSIYESTIKSQICETRNR